MAHRILIIEDRLGVAKKVRMTLALEGHSVEVAPAGEPASTSVRRWDPHLVILDVTAANSGGLNALRELRDEGYELPVLILSAGGAETELLRAFRAGADDYIVKPPSLPVLRARIAAMLRRIPSCDRPASTKRWTFGGVTVDAATHEVVRDGRAVPMRPMEFDLLLALLRRGGLVATRAELLEEVWRYAPDVVSRTIDVHVLALRRKLELAPANPRHLVTVRKVGYRFVKTAEGLTAGITRLESRPSGSDPHTCAISGNNGLPGGWGMPSTLAAEMYSGPSRNATVGASASR